MTLVPFTDCCAMLGIDAKTLRNWLRQANLEWAAHPKDARLKCLSTEQVEQVARLHARPLPWPLSAPPALPEAAPAKPESQAQLLEASLLLPTSMSEEADLIKKLAALETQVTSMQEQLAQLALALLRERELRYEQRLSTLEGLVRQALQPVPSSPEFQETVRSEEQDTKPRPGRCPHPAEQRTRPLLPLIEYGAHGQYVVICPQEGELPLRPDSPEWFAWLASVSSFRFVGKHGRFTACRVYDKGPTRSWQAHRVIHQRHYKPHLGVTEHLTIDSLEQAAARLQSYVDSRSLPEQFRVDISFCLQRSATVVWKC